MNRSKARAMTPTEINYRLLLKLGRLTFSNEDVNEAEALLAHPNFDKGAFLAACFKQKVAGLAYFNLSRWRLWTILPWLGFSLKLYYLGNMERNRRLQQEAGVFLDAVSNLSVDLRPLKGVVLVPLIYNDGGTRLSYDLDFFVKREDLSKLAGALDKLGYVQGRVDAKSGQIIPLPREEKLIWQLKMFEAPPFMKATNDPYLDYGNALSIDFSFGFSFAESKDISPLVLADEAVIGGYRTISVVDFFIQLCGHLYKEASNKSWIDIDHDINLIKFCDVREYALKMITPDMHAAIKSRSERLGAEKSVYFSLYHVIGLYEDRAIGSLLESMKFQFDDTSFMDAIYRQGGQKAVGKRAKTLVEAIGGV